MKKTIVSILLGAVFTIILLALVCNYYHPILIKWLTGSATSIGKPINATVYTDEILNNTITVFQIDDDKHLHSYLLSLKYFDKFGMLKYIYINPNEKWVGRPIGSGKNDYDMVMGSLLQSETGAHFVDFKNDIKGFNFDPHLSSSNKQITFNTPPNTLKFNTIRILLN